jgi:hypothetical protein
MPRSLLIIVLRALPLVVPFAVWPGFADGAAQHTQSSCSSAQLFARSYLGGGGAGSAAEVIVLVARGRACVLRGYLRVRLLDGAHLPIGTLAKRSVVGFMGERLPVRAVRLSKGSRASFEIAYTEEPSVLGPGNRSCELISWLGIELGRSRLDVPTKIRPCGGRFNESAVQPGVIRLAAR